MTYTKDSGEVSALVRPVNAVETVKTAKTFGRFVATGDNTHNEFGLFEWNMQPRAGGPDPHFHRTYSESFYVISGSVTIFDGREWVETAPGDFVHVPKGGLHGFRNDTDDPASMLILFSPGEARENYFRELTEIVNTGRKLTDEEWTEFFVRHDNHFV
jgi:quercetin dioxygenase-like cupin family protein